MNGDDYIKKVGEICRLSELLIGQSGRVIKMNEENKKVRRHLLDMGITRGVNVTVKKIAPIGDPIDILLRDYELCICKDDLSKIEISEETAKLSFLNRYLKKISIFL